jgi:hypothetical protein
LAGSPAPGDLLSWDLYYLHHDLTDDSIWYAAMSPLGGGAFGLGRTEPAGREVPMLATGDFRLMKLYDA